MPKSAPLRYKKLISLEEVLQLMAESTTKRGQSVMRDWKMAKLWLLREMSGGKRVGA